MEIFSQVNEGCFNVVSINRTFSIRKWRIRNIDFKTQVPRYCALMKKGVRAKLISFALNINVCFVAIPFQEDPAPAVERLNDRDYLFGKPHETAD